MAEAPCAATTRDGTPCQAPRLLGDACCFWHSEATADERREAQRLGGLHRRREGALQGAFDVHDLATVADLRRLLEVVVLDALSSLPPSVHRGRVLLDAVAKGARLAALAHALRRAGAGDEIHELHLHLAGPEEDYLFPVRPRAEAEE